MKFLYYTVGVMQILTGFMLAWSIAPAWRWVWISAAVFWFFVGVGLGILRIAKLVTTKGGAGSPLARLADRATRPAPDKEA
jgi:hypothetical protein